MKAVAALASILPLTIASGPAMAQHEIKSRPENPGMSTTGSTKYATIEATPAMLMGDSVQYNDSSPGHFRMVFRIVSAQGNMPYFALNSLGTIKEWIAYSSYGASCKLEDDGIKGIDLAWADSLQTVITGLPVSRFSPSTTLSDTRPSIMIANFRCDTAITADDLVTVQLRIYANFQGKWIPLDYTFENAPAQNFQ